MSYASHRSAPAAEQALLLPEHHLVIEQACLELLSDTYADDPRRLCQRWRTFEQEVEDHFVAEEQLILPGFGAAAPGSAAQILADHARIRQHLAELAIEVDLHVIRARTVHALVDELRDHAAREQELLYPWAMSHAPAAELSAVQQRIARWLR